MQKGKYIETIDTTHSDFKHFRNFLYKHFKKSEHYDQMRPVSNQPVRFLATTKTHKLTWLNDITVENLKLRPIIDLTGTYTYSTPKVIANYLGPLSKNHYTISDILKFPDLLKSADTNANYEDVSYDVESLFTSIPVAETIEYILKRINTNKELKPLCKKSIFKKDMLSFYYCWYAIWDLVKVSFFHYKVMYFWVNKLNIVTIMFQNMKIFLRPLNVSTLTELTMSNWNP